MINRLNPFYEKAWVLKLFLGDFYICKLNLADSAVDSMEEFKWSGPWGQFDLRCWWGSVVYIPVHQAEGLYG